jgi:hypothetical protein
MSKLQAKIDAALDRYLAARAARGEGRGTEEEFIVWLKKQDILDDDDHRELMSRFFDQVWREHTRVALGLDEDDEEGDRIAVETDGRSIELPRYIVNPSETDDFGDSRHWHPKHAKVRHHRLHAEWMVRVGSVVAGREQLAVNAELLRRAAGNEDAQIGELLAV